MPDMNSLLREIKGETAETRTIAIVSGKGGAGKTATAANLALGLQEHGEKVVAIDCDQAASNLSLHLGLNVNPNRTLQSALNSQHNVLDAINLHRTGLMVIPSTHAIYEEHLHPRRLKQLLERIDGTVIIDAPPGLTDNVYTVLDVADEVIIVTNPEIPAVTDAVKLVEAAKEIRGGLDNCWVVVNKAREVGKEVMEPEIEMALDLPLASIIPYDAAVKEAVHEQNPVIHYAPHSPAAVEYRKLAAWLVGREHEEHPLTPLKRFLHNVKNRLL